ncbi:MAG: RluA family pseudouridine synthase [Acetobacteraceae bacterium]
MSVEQILVAEDEADIRLDRWFRRHFPGLRQGAIERLCRTGQVRVDGRRAHGATRLAAGQAVRIPPLPAETPPGASPRAPEPPDPEAVKQLAGRILYRDDLILVLDKPAGLPVQGGPGIRRHLDGLLEGLRGNAHERPRLVHRLDRETAGVLVVACSAFAAASLARSFRGREVQKLYWAVVLGAPSEPRGRIDVPLVRMRTHRFGRTEPAGDNPGARAISDYVTRERAGNRFAWLELSPLTGRTHQLRVHCAALGTPILGDVTYGGDDARPRGFPTTLHLLARRIALPHPAGGHISVEAPLPAHLSETFRLLGFAAPRAHPPRWTRGCPA